jgi:hypothetical protein
MIRRVLLGAGLLATALGGAFAAQSGIAGASGPPVTLSGQVTCAVIGADHFSPPLTNGGTSAESIRVKAKLSGCSGPGTAGGGVTLTKGTMDVTTSTANNNCGTTLNGSSLPALTGTINWKGSGGKVEASTVSVNGAILYNPNGDDGAGTIQTFLPTNVTGGSYSSENGSFSNLTSDKAGGALDARCGATGLKSVSFGKSAGTVVGSVTISGGGS